MKRPITILIIILLVQLNLTGDASALDGMNAQAIPVAESDDDASMLWGSHAPHYVEHNGVRYAHIFVDDDVTTGQPAYAAILRSNTSGWDEAWRSPVPDMHQTGAIAIDNSGTLHLIYPKAEADGNGSPLPTYGEVVHRTFPNLTNFASSNVVDTSAWGPENYYLGMFYYQPTGTIRLCGTQWSSGLLRCGAFDTGSGTWGPPAGVASYNDGTVHRYVYPGIAEDADGYWLSLQAYKEGDPAHVRALTIMARVDKNNVLVGSNLLGSGLMAMTIQDLKPYGNGGYAYLATRHLAPNEVVLVTQDSPIASAHTDTIDLPGVADLQGTSYDLAVATDGSVHVFGSGLHTARTDQGWSPFTRYAHVDPSVTINGDAHVIRNQTSTALDESEITILQQGVTNGTSVVLEVSFD